MDICFESSVVRKVPLGYGSRVLPPSFKMESMSPLHHGKNYADTSEAKTHLVGICYHDPSKKFEFYSKKSEFTSSPISHMFFSFRKVSNISDLLQME